MKMKESTLNMIHHFKSILINSSSNQNIFLELHRITKHMIYKCNICQTEFMTEYDLKTHIDTTPHTVSGILVRLKTEHGWEGNT